MATYLHMDTRVDYVDTIDIDDGCVLSTYFYNDGRMPQTTTWPQADVDLFLSQDMWRRPPIDPRLVVSEGL